MYDYFQAALRRRPAEPSGEPGPVVHGADGNLASFRLTARDGRVVAAAYRATTCVTLVALCEHIRELAIGRSLDELGRMTAADLRSLHPEIPASRADRADLAIRALRFAVESVKTGEKE